MSSPMPSPFTALPDAMVFTSSPGAERLFADVPGVKVMSHGAVFPLLARTHAAIVNSVEEMTVEPAVEFLDVLSDLGPAAETTVITDIAQYLASGGGLGHGHGDSKKLLDSMAGRELPRSFVLFNQMLARFIASGRGACMDACNRIPNDKLPHVTAFALAVAIIASGWKDGAEQAFTALVAKADEITERA